MYTPQNIPLDAIVTQLLPRGRTIICAEAQTELQSSIARNGLRLPIEVYKTDTGFAPISGYRRLLAYRSLYTPPPTTINTQKYPQFCGNPLTSRQPLPHYTRKSAAKNAQNYAPSRKWSKPLTASL